MLQTFPMISCSIHDILRKRYTLTIYLSFTLLTLCAIGSPALRMEGKTWDEYPDLTSTYEIPLFSKVVSITTATRYVDKDDGNIPNVFDLTAADLAVRTVTNVDIAAPELTVTVPGAASTSGAQTSKVPGTLKPEGTYISRRSYLCCPCNLRFAHSYLACFNLRHRLS